MRLNRTGVKGLVAMVLALAINATVAANELTHRIVGGELIGIERAPATLALLSTEAMSRGATYAQSQFCGGTLIAERWVLTAAHCLLDGQGNTVEPSSVSVLAGSTDLANPVSEPVPVQGVIVHERYVNAPYGDDVALLELSYGSGATVASINTDAIATGEGGYIAGWGAVVSGASGQQFDTRLRRAAVRMLPGGECGLQYGDYAGTVDGRQLCAGISGGGVDTCQGDSGGPMYRATSRGVLQVAGITSWGIGCGEPEHPGVYTDVASYAEWINRNIATGDQVMLDESQAAVDVSGILIGTLDTGGTGVTVTDGQGHSLTLTATEDGLSVSGSTAVGGAGATWWLLPLLLGVVVWRFGERFSIQL